ncbi:hypothetical protein ACFRAR_34105 [Kitasatospora sp. NPDC056651]|uniref:hypothetical protein n=1 Tax=Kitasatospora sp. NPDC056651 TaxID=3345892 RepID=UPI0036A0C42D
MTTATALPATGAGTASPPASPPASPSASPTAARPLVRPGRPGEEDAIAAVLAAAFADDALMHWAFPDPGHRARVMPAFFRFHVDHCLERRGVLVAHRATNDDGDGDGGSGGGLAGEPLGALLFLPSGSWEGPEHGDGTDDDALAEAIEAPTHPLEAGRLAAITRLQAQRHPRHRPHHYLAFVGVHPGARRTLTGHALAHAFRAEVDTAGQAAYTETSSPAGARLAAAHGFTPFGAAIALPGGGPRLAPAWRGPR